MHPSALVWPEGVETSSGTEGRGRAHGRGHLHFVGVRVEVELPFFVDSYVF